jgi:glycine/D-amino acid oxidase-like deaminating enzyme/nitrite reductase/ring-hydroxylating ferredoxin subunit
MNELIKDHTKSLWETIEIPQYKTLTQNLTTEVCVIGGGISGISIAYQLAKQGHKVILLEGSRIASGQSGRTTAHLTYQVEEQLSNLLKHMNIERLKIFVNSHKQAIDIIEETILEEKIDCDFRRLDGYLFLGPDDSLEILKDEVRIGHEIGLDLSLIEKVPGFPDLGPAVVYPKQAQFHPTKYISGLLNAMKKFNVEVYENAHVTEFKITNELCEVISGNGLVVSSKYLVIATDSPVNNRFYIHTKQSAYRTYVIGFEMNQKIEVPLLWDTSDPYHYIRQADNILLIGGEDHRSGQAPESEPLATLEIWAREKFPALDLGKVKWKWSGQIFEPVDQIGYIGRNPGFEKNVFITTGQSGIGMTSSAIASRIIPDLIEGISNSMIEVFDPTRVNLRDVPHYLKENSNTAFQYKDWVTPAAFKHEAQIPAAHGGIVREGLSKTCVYHSESDNFEKKSAVCTHLGGIVHWNELEKTWDCPCHGSRFNIQGKVIEGPALNDLTER